MTPQQVAHAYRRAADWGAAHKSDPFAAARARAHFRSGAANLGGIAPNYTVTFRRELRNIEINGVMVAYTIDAPINMKV